MRWTKEDVSKYVTAKEYIDSALIPLIPLTLSLPDEQLPSLAFQKEVAEVLCGQVEKEVQGRMMLFPTYVYGEASVLEQEISRLNNLSKHLKGHPFEHIFYFTFDSNWKKHEVKLEGNLIWMPVLKDGDLQSKETNKTILDQVQQIRELIRTYWS